MFYLILARDAACSKSLQSCNKRISVQLQTLGEESGVSVNFPVVCVETSER